MSMVITTALTSAVILGTTTLTSQSKANEPVKNNVNITNQKTLLSAVTQQNSAELAIKTVPAEPVNQAGVNQLATVSLDKTNQTESNKLAEIAANAAKQEEIDRIAAERPATSTQPEIAGNNVSAQQKAASVANVQRSIQATINTSSLTQDEEDAAAAAEAERLAKLEAERLAKLESDRRELLLRNQTITSTRLSTYLTPTANIISVLNRAVELHSGDPTNTCVYFSTEAMRRISIWIPTATCNTGQYLSYLRSNAWISSSAIKELIPGNICFTTNGWNGYPTHTFVFMGWFTEGDYTWAYVADNQGTSVHLRNMGATYATDAFAFFMHTPTTPQAINAIPSGYNSINIGWSAVAGVSGYQVYRATSSTGVYSLISTTSSTRYNNTGLTPNKTYYYKVSSYRVVGSVKQSSALPHAISAIPAPVLAPDVPLNIKALSTSSSSIRLSWSKVDGASGYELFKANSSNGAYSLLYRMSTSYPYYTNSKLTTGDTPYYKVRSFLAIGNTRVYSDWSDIISSELTLPTTVPAPSSPSNVKAISTSSSSIRLSWSKVDGASGYELFKANSSNATYSLLYRMSTSYPYYTNSKLTTGETSYYKVRSFLTVGNTKVYSDWSDVISAEPASPTPVPAPASPSNVKAISTSSSSIRLSWSRITGSSGYEVYKATSSNGAYSFLTRMSEPYPYYTNSKLTTGTTYYYKVRSFVTAGNTRVYSDWSTAVSAQP